MAAEARRAFFALWPPEPLAARLLELSRCVPGRPMHCADLHLTLVFLGDLDSTRLILAREIAAGLALPAENLQAGFLAHWSHNTILWAGLQRWPEPMVEFVDALHGRLRSAGFHLDPRRFTPHLTLARRASPQAETLPALPEDLPPWSVTEWHLAATAEVSDSGLRYRKLASWPARSS